MHSANLLKTYIKFEPDEQEGVFRFSTQPEEGADTAISAYIAINYGGFDFCENLKVDNDKTSSNALSLTAPEYGNLRDGSAKIYLYGNAPFGSNVTIYVNGEAESSVTPSQYTGRYSHELSLSGSNRDTFTVYTQSGDIKTEEKTIKLASNRTDVEKLLLTHDNNHTAFTIDITDAYKYGATPYIAYNPTKELAFGIFQNQCPRYSQCACIQKRQRIHYGIRFYCQ